MIVEYMCPPAILYLAFSVTQIIIDMFRGDTNTAFLKFIVMIIFTVVLNLLCSAGLGIISWFIVFIPFILMTYITTVLAFVFGIPKKDNLRPERPERKSREDHERERNHDIVGGCAGTRYGCCYDGTTAKADDRGSNCPHRPRPDPRPKPKPEPKPHPEPKPPHKKGCAEGELIGGNLSLIYALTGSISDIDTKDKILFIEDLDEYLYHIDRMMINLKRSGKLSNLAGLIIGGMTDMKDNTIPYGKTVEEIILDAVAEYNYTVCFSFPAGHIDKNMAVYLGRKVKLNVGEKTALTYL